MTTYGDTVASWLANWEGWGVSAFTVMCCVLGGLAGILILVRSVRAAVASL